TPRIRRTALRATGTILLPPRSSCRHLRRIGDHIGSGARANDGRDLRRRRPVPGEEFLDRGDDEIRLVESGALFRMENAQLEALSAARFQLRAERTFCGR